MWLFYALLSAVFISLRKVGDKQLSEKLHYLTFGWAQQLFAVPVLGVALLAAGELINPFTLGVAFWAPTILLWITFYPLSTFLYVAAMKQGELSKLMPLQSFGPIFALLLGWSLLNQAPSSGATVGIAIVVLGIYILNLKGRYLHNPLKIFTHDKANLYMVINILLIACAGVLNTVAIKASEPIYYSFISTLGAIPVLHILARALGVKVTKDVKAHLVPMANVGALFGAAYITNILAISVGPLAYVSTVRSSSTVVSAALGIIYLKESLTTPKLVGLVSITAGSIIIGLS